jgi:isocitrate dehydrogenase
MKASIAEPQGKDYKIPATPARKLGELDNRGSHFYLALYWALELAKQDEDLELKSKFEPIAKKLNENEQKIVADFASTQGHSVDIGGYYLPDSEKLAAVMRPLGDYFIRAGRSFESNLDC